LHLKLKKKDNIRLIDAHRGGGGTPHVPPIKILKNFHIKMQ
jgi:hypothetical protein